LWSKVTLTQLPAVQPLKWFNWLSIFVVVCISVLFFMLFVLQIDTANSKRFIIIFTIVSLFMTGLLFSLRLFIYGLAIEKVKIWDEEIKQHDERWQHWAGQSLAVLQSVVITPQNLSSDDFQSNDNDLNFAANEIFRFNKTNAQFYLDCYEWIFSNLYDCLNQIESRYSVVVLQLNANKQQKTREKLVQRAYKNIGLNLPLKFSYPDTLNDNKLDINQFIDNEDTTLYLIIADNTQAIDSSAFMSALLLANHPLYTNMTGLQPESQLLRTMKTLPETLTQAMAQMNEIQRDFKDIQQVWYSQLDSKTMKQLRALFSQYDITLYESDDYLATHALDVYFGYPNNRLSYWLLLALATQSTKKIHQTQLVAAKIADELVFTVVKP
jgi:hypothetical protein